MLDNENEEGEETLDQAFAEITNGLLCDTTLTGFNRKLLQGITRGERMHVYGSVALDNETPILELQFDMTADLGTAIFKPTIIDDFITLHVDARPIQNPDAPIVEMEWNMQTGEINTTSEDAMAKIQVTPNRDDLPPHPIDGKLPAEGGVVDRRSIHVPADPRRRH